jgi:chromosomal replication initiator protein
LPGCSRSSLNTTIEIYNEASEELGVAELLQGTWSDTLTIIQGSIPKERFNLWFRNTEIVETEGDSVKIGVANAFIGSWLQEHFYELVQAALEATTGRKLSVRFVVSPRLYRHSHEAELREKQELIETIDADTPRKTHCEAGAADRYDLEDFVVGHSNRLAYAAAMHVATNRPSDPDGVSGFRRGDLSLNPLVIHGSCGLGKTHLLRGICNRWTRNGIGRALYISSESFTNQFLAALHTHSADGFRRKFRDIDLLALDDLQFLADKRATQDEFLQIYNSLSGINKQVVLASDAHPKEIKELRETLSTRLVSGMIVRLDSPEYETRLAILRAKLGLRRQVVNDDVLALMAENLRGSVRELEGAVTTLVATASLTGERIDLPAAQRIIAALLSGKRARVCIHKIEEAVAAAWFVKLEDLQSKRRHKSIALPRHVAMYLARELTSMSWPEIGRQFGGRNHTAAIFAHRKISKAVEEDPELRERINRLRATLQG